MAMNDFDLSKLNELDFSNIGAWPMPVKIILILIVCAGVAVGGYYLDIKKQRELLATSEKKEIDLKQEFERKQAKAANLEEYKQQLKDIEESFGAMLRRLPSKTEVENLLIDISQTGLASGVEFKLFRPQGEQFKDFYAELPIQMNMVGTYHEFGKFVSGVAALPRIVTLHNINISGSGANLTMSVTAKTYRYLDDAEKTQ